MKDLDEKIRAEAETGSHPAYLRGYCRIYNRHYFYRHQLDVEYIQFHQHHGGVCQRGHYTCATIKSKIRA